MQNNKRWCVQDPVLIAKAKTYITYGHVRIDTPNIPNNLAFLAAAYLLGL